MLLKSDPTGLPDRLKTPTRRFDFCTTQPVTNLGSAALRNHAMQQLGLLAKNKNTSPMLVKSELQRHFSKVVLLQVTLQRKEDA